MDDDLHKTERDLHGEPPEDDETLTFEEWENADDKFALRVEGDSMIGDQIRHGDYVIIKRQAHAHDGQIVALRDDIGEITLKRYSRQMGHVWLESSNPTCKTIVRESVEIIGVLVGVVRKY